MITELVYTTGNYVSRPVSIPPGMITDGMMGCGAGIVGVGFNPSRDDH